MLFPDSQCKIYFFPLFSRTHTDERAQPSRVPREAAQSEEASVCPKGILPPAVCCPQQLASPSPGSVVPHTPDSVGCSASLWLCSLCRLPWEMAQGSQLDQESIPCLSQLHHPSAGSHPSLQDRGALQQPPLSAPMCWDWGFLLVCLLFPVKFC